MNQPPVMQGALAAEVEALPRPFEVYDVSDVLGLQKGKKIAVVLRPCGDEETSILEALKHLYDASKRAGDGAEAARTDETMRVACKAIQALCDCLYDVNADGTPSPFAAFPAGPSWVRKHLRKDQVESLFRLLQATEWKHGLAKPLSDDRIQALLPLLHANLGNNLVEVLLSPLDRGELVNFAAVVASRLHQADGAVEILMREREEQDAKIAALEGTVAKLEAAQGAETVGASEG